MTIKEYVFKRPLPVPENADFSSWLGRQLPQAATRDLPVGKSDITPPEWNFPTHRFLVHAFPDGTGLLDLQATQADSAIHEIGSVFPDMKEITQRIAEPKKQIVLGGMQFMPSGRKRVVVLRVLEYVPDGSQMTPVEQKKKRRR